MPTVTTQTRMKASSNQTTLTASISSSGVGTPIAEPVINGGILTQSGGYILTQSGGYLIIQ